MNDSHDGTEARADSSAGKPALQLVIAPDAYELRSREGLAILLERGADALLAGAGAQLRELDIEAAIERAEEWLMRYSKSFATLELDVHDVTGRLHAQLGLEGKYTVEEIEQAFTRVHDAIVRGGLADRRAGADVILLRELAHHGRLSGLVLHDARPEAA